MRLLGKEKDEFHFVVSSATQRFTSYPILSWILPSTRWNVSRTRPRATTSGRCSLDKVANHPIRYVPNDETRVSQSLQPELYKEGGREDIFFPVEPTSINEFSNDILDIQPLLLFYSRYSPNLYYPITTVSRAPNRRRACFRVDYRVYRYQTRSS